MTQDSNDDRALGLCTHIDRRDFFAGSAAMLGGMALGCPFSARASEGDLPDAYDWQIDAENFNGPSGKGDYARSNGNVYETTNSAHRMRDGFRMEDREVRDTGETYDLVVVGGGPAGMGAAFHWHEARNDQRCLILDNHPVAGGLAKRNEMDVAGHRLIAPQCSNVSVYALGEDDPFGTNDFVEKIGLRQDWQFAELTGTDKPLEFDRTNYIYYYPPLKSDSIAHFYRDDSGGYRMSRNPWANDFADAPLSDSTKADLLRWRNAARLPDRPDLDSWLDGQTFKQYLTGHHGLGEEAFQLISQWVGGAKAFNGEMCCAYAMSMNATGGYRDFGEDQLSKRFDYYAQQNIGVFGFPGGNGMQARFFLKYLIPDAIDGDREPHAIVRNPIRFDRLDRRGSPTRLRQEATVVDVRHDGPPETAERVFVTYERGGRVERVAARRVVMASGNWVNKYILADAPDPVWQAMAAFKHAPILIANVALTNWRFMERAGVTACLFGQGEFGFQCNIRQPMHVGAYQPPLDPNQPIFLTFYAPFIYPGESTEEQLIRGRNDLLNTRFSEFERRIRKQLVELFGPYGFEPSRDIAGIILNRWGHAYVVPETGFYFGTGGNPPPRQILRDQGYGRVRFAHSELTGRQGYERALTESYRAVNQLLTV